MFDSARGACYAFRYSRCPSGAPITTDVSEGCLRMPFYALALQAQGTQPAAGAGELSTKGLQLFWELDESCGDKVIRDLVEALKPKRGELI